MKPLIDISSWQRPELIDYDRLAAQIDGAILRVGYGTHKDTAFERHYAELHKRGVPLGAYHFPLDGNITEQLVMVGAALKGKPLPLKLWVDVENPPVPNKLSKATVDTIVPALEVETGVQVGIYTSHYKWREIMQDSSAHAGRWLWVANYGVSKPLLPLPWKTWKFWQHTDKGRLDGYGRNLDMNRFNGTEDDFRSWVKPSFTIHLPMIANQNEPPKDERKWLFEAKVVTTYDFLPVRKAPNTVAEMVGKCYFGDIVKVYEADKDLWYRVGENEWVWGRRCMNLQEPLKTLAYPIAREFPVSQAFGINSGTYGAAKGHNGVDYACWVGSELVAAADGFVETWEPFTQYGYGRHVRIRVRGGVLIYGHMKEIFVKKGEKVKKGQVIGTSDGEKGNPYAGFSTGAHLHFEYRIDREPIPLRPGNHTYWAIDTLPITEKPLQ